MHLNQLEYFTATIENGSFAAAAKKIYITPQALEKAIHNLENELGGLLFEPAGRSYQPTRLGLTLYEPALETIAKANKLKDIARTQTRLSFENTRITLAVADAPRRCTWFTSGMFEPFLRDHPNIDLTLKFNTNGTCIAAVRCDIVDAAVTMGYVKEEELQSRRLFSFPVEVALSHSHPLASSAYEKLALRNIADYPIAAPIDKGPCFEAIRKAFNLAGASPHFVEIAPGDEERFVAKNGVILVANRSLLKRDLPNATVKRIVEKDQITLPICFVTKRGETRDVLQRIASYLVLASGKMKRFDA